MRYYYFLNTSTGNIIRLQNTDQRSAFNVLRYQYGNEYAYKNFRFVKEFPSR